MNAAVRAATRGLAGALRDPGPWVLVGAGVVQVLARSPRLHATLLIAAVVVAVAAAVRGPGGGRGGDGFGSAGAPTGAPSGTGPSRGGPAPARPGAGGSARPGRRGAGGSARPGLRGAGGSPRLVAWGAIVVSAAVLGQFRRYTLPPAVGVGIAALGALVWAGRVGQGAAPNGSRPASRGVALWLAVVAGLLAWEVAAFAFQPSIALSSAAHPTLSGLLDPLLARSGGRTAAMLAWATAGWLLLVPAPPATPVAPSPPGDGG